MFSGIVTTIVPVHSYTKNKQGALVQLQFTEDLFQDLTFGASVSVSGVCLTVVETKDDVVSFDISEETLRLTTLGLRKAGDRVNIERSIRVGDEIGGHIVSGHVHGVAELIEKKENGEYRFRIPEELKKFVLEKGFVALDGASLTVVDIDAGECSVAFIPETLQTTTFGSLEIGDMVNIEVDQQTRAIVETVERLIRAKDSA